MITLLYLSSATIQFTETSLATLLTRARLHNSRLGITGMLLYHDGNFLQVLEGEETSVRSLFDKIAQDPRHQGVLKLLDRPLTERLFGEWSMAFRTVDDLAIEHRAGYSAFLNHPFREQLLIQPSVTYHFLMAFRDGVR